MGVVFLAPSILPASLLGEIPSLQIPFLMPADTATTTPSITASPTLTMPPVLTATITATKIKPTVTFTPTRTALPSVTPRVIASPVDTITPLVSTNPPPVGIGGGDGQIAYASDQLGIPQIFLANLASDSITQITEMPSGACQPSWSPDGMKLVFISPCKDKDEKYYYQASLYIINVDGTELTPIPSVPGGGYEPAWSPTGDVIAFTSQQTGQQEIFTVNLNDLTLITQITKGTAKVESHQPIWSPDGSQIVYSVKRLGVSQIWLMNADGSDQKQIVRSGLEFSDYSPTWSPDGTMIIFNQRCATQFCLPYLMSISAINYSAEQPRRLRFNLISVENVHYSPDGTLLVYEDENKDIFYMAITGASHTRITTDPGLDFNPAWRPAPKVP